MKVAIFFILAFLLSTISTIAQEVDSQQMLREPRFNYYKKIVIIFNEYLNTNSGLFNTTDIRVLYPLGNKALNLRFDLPIVTANIPNSGNQTGLGDIDFSLAYIPHWKDNTAFAIRGKLNLPTASRSAFGTGKWVFNAALFLGHYWDSQKKWFSITTLEQQFSFAGQTARTAVNTSYFENVIYYSFHKNWVGANATIRYSYTLKGYRNIFALEYGHKFTAHFNAYIHPSLGFGSQKSYTNGIEIGALIYF